MKKAISSNLAQLTDYFPLGVCSEQLTAFHSNHNQEDAGQYAYRKSVAANLQIVRFEGDHERLDVQQFGMGDEQW